jgi:hypothetical protein
MSTLVRQEIFFYPQVATILGRKSPRTITRNIEKGMFNRQIDPTTGKPIIYRDKASGNPIVYRKEIEDYLEKPIDQYL